MMKKLDQVILLTAMEVLSKLCGGNIDCEKTIESREYHLAKIPASVKVKNAAEFNEYIKERMIPGFHEHVMDRFERLSYVHLDKSVYPVGVSAENMKKVKDVFDKKAIELSEVLTNATLKELEYFNCSFDWIESPEEKTSCSFYLRSSLQEVVKLIFGDIYDTIMKDEVKPQTTISEPKDSEDKGNTNSGKTNQETAKQPKVEKEPEKKPEVNKPEEVAVKAETMDDQISKIEAENSTELTAEESELVGQVIKDFIPEAADSAADKDKKNDKNSKKQNAAANNKKPEEKVLEVPESKNKKGDTPKINLQFPTPNEISDLISKPESAVKFEAPLVTPKYDDKLINDTIMISDNIFVSETDLEAFKESLLVAAKMINDYNEENNSKEPVLFGVARLYNYNDYELVSLKVNEDKYYLTAPNDEDFMVILVKNDSYSFNVKTKQPELATV